MQDGSIDCTMWRAIAHVSMQHYLFTLQKQILSTRAPNIFIVAFMYKEECLQKEEENLDWALPWQKSQTWHLWFAELEVLVYSLVLAISICATVVCYKREKYRVLFSILKFYKFELSWIKLELWWKTKGFVGLLMCLSFHQCSFLFTLVGTASPQAATSISCQCSQWRSPHLLRLTLSTEIRQVWSDDVLWGHEQSGRMQSLIVASGMLNSLATALLGNVWVERSHCDWSQWVASIHWSMFCHLFSCTQGCARLGGVEPRPVVQLLRPSPLTFTLAHSLEMLIDITITSLNEWLFNIVPTIPLKAFVLTVLWCFCTVGSCGQRHTKPLHIRVEAQSPCLIPSGDPVFCRKLQKVRPFSTRCVSKWGSRDSSVHRQSAQTASV